MFVPTIAAVNAEMEKADKPYPVVLISHGSGGTAEKLFWLAGYLVEHGFVAIGVDSPGNMTLDNNGDGVVSQWVRALDSTFALDRVAELKEFKGKLDFSKIAAAGHSSGGTTVLLLAGARMSSDRLTNPTPKCGGSKDPYAEKSCKELKAINYKSYSKSVVEKDYADQRVKAVVSLDPGLEASFDPASFKTLRAKTLILAAEKLAAPQDEILSKDFAKLVSKDEFEILPGSYHMTFLQACKPGVEFDDPELVVLCANGEKKLKLQQATREKTLKFFKSNL